MDKKGLAVVGGLGAIILGTIILGRAKAKVLTPEEIEQLVAEGTLAPGETPLPGLTAEEIPKLQAEEIAARKEAFQEMTLEEFTQLPPEEIVGTNPATDELYLNFATGLPYTQEELEAIKAQQIEAKAEEMRLAEERERAGLKPQLTEAMIRSLPEYWAFIAASEARGKAYQAWQEAEWEWRALEEQFYQAHPEVIAARQRLDDARAVFEVARTAEDAAQAVYDAAVQQFL